MVVKSKAVSLFDVQVLEPIPIEKDGCVHGYLNRYRLIPKLTPKEDIDVCRMEQPTPFNPADIFY